jgi:2-phospho-L-lactate guanylyltransferase
MRIIPKTGTIVLYPWPPQADAHRCAIIVTVSSSAVFWTVVVPVKGTADGKSRMSPGIGAAQRARLVEAFALDAVAALVASRSVHRVIVVTDETAQLAGPLQQLGAEIVPDPGAGLNAAVAAGITAAMAGAGTSGTVPSSADRAQASANPRRGAAAWHGGTAALLGDLPCLRPTDIDRAFDLAAQHALAVVPDAEGSGSTLITALPGVALVPRFGAGSAARHREAGHAVLDVPATSTLRLDVDTEHDLAEARSRGVGPHTRAALA